MNLVNLAHFLPYIAHGAEGFQNALLYNGIVQ